MAGSSVQTKMLRGGVAPSTSPHSVRLKLAGATSNSSAPAPTRVSRRWRGVMSSAVNSSIRAATSRGAVSGRFHGSGSWASSPKRTMTSQRKLRPSLAWVAVTRTSTSGGAAPGSMRRIAGTAAAGWWGGGPVSAPRPKPWASDGTGGADGAPAWMVTSV